MRYYWIVSTTRHRILWCCNLEWIVSYLTGRSQTVVVNGVKSATSALVRGVPQSSVLGPLLFLLYTTEIQDIIRSFDLAAHVYADDTQLYFHARPSECDTTAPKLLACIYAIGLWLPSNRLRLNPDKTEFIWFASPHHLTSVPQSSLTVSSASIAPSHTVRDLGVLFHDTLCLNDYVSSVVQSCFFQ